MNPPDPADVRRVVVCSVGAVTSQGIGSTALWYGVRAGHSAIGPVRRFGMDGYRTDIGAEVPHHRIPNYDYLTAIGGTEREPALDYALTAAEEAIAGATLRGLAAERFGVALGTCNGGLRTLEQILHGSRNSADDTDADADADEPHYLLAPPHAMAEALSHAFDLRGPVLSVNTACASGAHAIAHAVEIIRAGRADAMLVGGTDCFTETAFAGFTSLESLSMKPAAPYSKSRDGLSLGEGSGMLVLVEEGVARAANAPVLAEVLGYGLSADGYHVTAPHPAGEGAARAIRGALEVAGLRPEDVGYINGHGTGTPKNDSAESNAVRAALGEAAEKVALSSSKSMIGHLLGAAGAVEAIITVKALEEQLAPPTANYDGFDPKCGLDAVPVVSRPLAMDVALSNNFAFAGANVCVAFGRPGQRLQEPAALGTERVVITGIGVISSGGNTPEDLWRAWQDGTRLGKDEDGLRVARAAFDPADYTTPRERRRVDRLSLLAIATGKDALAHAGLTADERVGVVLGTGLGPMRSTADFLLPVFDSDPSAANPSIFPNTVYNAAAGQVSMVLGAKGPTSTITSGHAAGASALTVAYDLLRQGRADAVLCPAVDELSPGVVEAYRRLPGLDAGFTLAEAAVTLVLERESVARARGATILAEFSGHASASDAVGIGRWNCDGDGVGRAMAAALEEAGAETVESVWANANGVAAADQAETRALDRLSGAGIVHRPKHVLGDPIGAGAHVAAVLALTSWATGAATGPALLNSSTLGGTHVSIVLRPASEI